MSMPIVEKLVLRLIQRRVQAWFTLEDRLRDLDGCLTSTAESPQRSWPDPAKVPAGTELPFKLRMAPTIGPLLASCIHQAKRAIRSVDENPRPAKQRLEPAFLERFERRARDAGVSVVGYTDLPRELIFRDKAVAFGRAIVLLKEMDPARIALAPSLATFRMVFETYDTLGKIVNDLSQYLRRHGYNAHGVHPLAGLALLPPLAARAGLGWHGRHGLLITPQHGPRQRIAAIFTDIEDLPLAGQPGSHVWISDFCATCGRCIRTCPADAIREEPLVEDSGRKTHILRERCLPYFNEHEACTVCIKECTFAKRGYERIFQTFERRTA
jgi:ferredoxin